MKLQLRRPIVFFDLEATGLNLLTDRIIEVSMLKLMPSGETERFTSRINPEMPIGKESITVHGITDEMVADAPVFKQVARRIAQFLTGCDIAGFNSTYFDVPLLDQELQRADVDFDFSRAKFIDVQTIFHKKEPRNLVAAYSFYCGKDLTNAHSASADTEATCEVLMAQLERYDDLPCDVDALSEYSSRNRNVDLAGRLVYDEQKRIIINFGKYKGREVTEVLRRDPSYYDWIMKGDFMKNTKDVFTKIKLSLK